MYDLTVPAYFTMLARIYFKLWAFSLILGLHCLRRKLEAQKSTESYIESPHNAHV